MKKTFNLSATNAYSFVSEQGKTHLIWLSALGMSSRFYEPLAIALNELGIDVTLLEQRGYGAHAKRASRHYQYSVPDLLADVDECLSLVKSAHPSQRIIIGGHSLGGHLAIQAASTHHDIDVLTVACALPYYAWFNGRLRLKIIFLLTLIKILTPLLGYYPGTLVGFGGRESRSLMRAWSYWARFGKYTEELAARCLQWQGNIIGIDILGDVMAPVDASANIKNLVPNAKIKRISFDLIERTKGKEHSQWCRGKNTNMMARLIYHCLFKD